MELMPPSMRQAIPANEDEPRPPRSPLVPERSDFLEGDAPAADKVEAFLAQALAATGTDAPTTAGALVPWICDALLSNHSADTALHGTSAEVGRGLLHPRHNSSN